MEFKKGVVSEGEIIVGGEPCEMYQDQFFAKVRSRFDWDVECVAESNFTWSNLKEGGGKGGGLMAFSKDKRWIVKDVTGEDHLALVTIAEPYSDWVIGDSLLARFFLHLRRKKDGKDYVVMNSFLPPEIFNAATVYDLKGTADDKLIHQMGMKVQQIHKRWYKTHWLMAEGVGLNGAVPKNRQIYLQGKRHAFSCKFHFSGTHQEYVQSMINADCQFLTELGLMDYSLLVAEHIWPEMQKGERVSQGVSGNKMQQPFICAYGEMYHCYYLGIIDFLQAWTPKKVLAHKIKLAFAPKPIATVPPKSYGPQFSNFFAQKIVGDGTSADEGSYIMVDGGLQGEAGE